MGLFIDFRKDGAANMHLGSILGPEHDWRGCGMLILCATHPECRSYRQCSFAVGFREFLGKKEVSNWLAALIISPSDVAWSSVPPDIQHLLVDSAEYGSLMGNSWNVYAQS